MFGLELHRKITVILVIVIRGLVCTEKTHGNVVIILCAVLKTLFFIFNTECFIWRQVRRKRALKIRVMFR